MKFELEDYKRNVTDIELLNDLKRVASLLGKDSVTIAEQNKHGRFSAMTMMRRFDSWPASLEKAGLIVKKRMNISKEELFRNLEEVWVTHGRQPHFSDMKTLGSRFGATTYLKRFGTWRGALQAFVTSINDAEVFSELDSYEQQARHPQSAGSRSINWRLRFTVMRRDNFKCKVCGRSPATDPVVMLHVDHIRAWSKGGPTVLENLQTLCSTCNIGKSDLEFENASSTEVQHVKS